MFFVGVTGQLITLILTVCLPFVFLVSSQPKTTLLQKKLNFENQIPHREVSNDEIDCVSFDFIAANNVQHINIEVREIFIQKIPQKKFRVKWKSFYAESSGNKAPPIFHCFSC